MFKEKASAVKGWMVLGKLLIFTLCTNCYAQSWDSPSRDDYVRSDSIPALVYNKSTKHFTLKNLDKRISTLKSLPPKKQVIQIKSAEAEAEAESSNTILDGIAEIECTLSI